jgi:hypothetical protein
MNEAMRGSLQALDEVVRRYEQDIALQRGIIAQLERRGQDTASARAILAQLMELRGANLQARARLFVNKS